MKSLSQIALIFSVACIALFAEIVHATPDKFGNGGAVWACQTQNGDILDLMLIDIDEARRENKLTVPETNLNHIAYLQEKKEWIRKNLTIQYGLIPYIEFVEQNISWIEGEMILVPDIANVSKPSPSLCKGGRWEAKTVVNFGDDDRVLASRELFESPFLTEMERTGLFLHEGIYSYMRTEYGDINSARSRKIVGYILSDLSDADKIQRIGKLLGEVNPNPVPTPQPQVSGYICGLRPSRFEQIYLGDKKTEEEARSAAMKACIDGEKPNFPFPIDIPGAPPGFPGFPGDGVGPQLQCKTSSITCEAYTSSAKKYSCEIRRGQKPFQAAGRTLLEAQKNTSEICMVSTDDKLTCNDPSEMDCSVQR